MVIKKKGHGTLHVGVFNHLAGVHISRVWNLCINNGLSVKNSAHTFVFLPFYSRVLSIT